MSVLDILVSQTSKTTFNNDQLHRAKGPPVINGKPYGKKVSKFHWLLWFLWTWASTFYIPNNPWPPDQKAQRYTKNSHCDECCNHFHFLSNLGILQTVPIVARHTPPFIVGVQIVVVKKVHGHTSAVDLVWNLGGEIDTCLQSFIVSSIRLCTSCCCQQPHRFMKNYLKKNRGFFSRLFLDFFFQNSWKYANDFP